MLTRLKKKQHFATISVEPFFASDVAQHLFYPLLEDNDAVALSLVSKRISSYFLVHPYKLHHTVDIRAGSDASCYYYHHDVVRFLVQSVIINRIPTKRLRKYVHKIEMSRNNARFTSVDYDDSDVKVTYLECKSVIPNASSLSSSYWSHLQTLVLSYEGHFNIYPGMLPESLTRLSVLNNGHILFNALPPSVTDLEIGRYVTCQTIAFPLRYPIPWHQFVRLSIYYSHLYWFPSSDNDRRNMSLVDLVIRNSDGYRTFNSDLFLHHLGNLHHITLISDNARGVFCFSYHFQWPTQVKTVDLRQAHFSTQSQQSLSLWMQDDVRYL